MISNLLTLKSQLEHITRVVVTAGRPSAPVGSDCDVIYVWLGILEDGNLGVTECMTKTRMNIGYEINSCYRDDAEDMTTQVFEEDAEKFTDLIEQVWETLVAHKDVGDLAGASRCDQIDLLPLVTQSRSGTSISAVGAIVI